MPELARQVDEFISAGFTGLWVQTYEHHDAIDEIQATCRSRDWPCVVWDMEAGVQAAPETMTQLTAVMDTSDNHFRQKPLPLIQRIPVLAERLDKDRSVWILKNFHHQQLLGSLSMIQALQNCLLEYRHEGARTPCLIVMSPVVDIPRELEKDFQILEYDLPTKPQLWEIATNICEGNEIAMPDEATDERRLILEAGSGMTRRNFENAVSLSIAKHGELRQDLLWDLKSQDLKKRNLLRIYDGKETFDDLGGFDTFKSFSTRLLKPRDNPLLYSRGLLLLGVPGAGKSAAIKALGNATGRKVLFMDMGTLRSKWAGESDANVDQALKIADAMAPCILAIDEIEKALSGAGQSSAQTDGGMGDRLFGKMLSWLNDHTSDVFFVGTCNNIAMLPPEFSRAERFDGMFFFDVPTKQEREAIWQIYLHMYGLAADKAERVSKATLQMSEGWTGAEIKACCRLSAILEVPMEEASRQIVPVAKAADEKLRTLREWASGRCMNASAPGLYDANAKAVATVSPFEAKTRRTINRASMN